MKTVYEVLQTSKQLHHYHRQKVQQQQVLTQQIQQHIQAHRALNRGLGLKKLYHLMPDCSVGRDQFIDIAVGLGLAIKKRKKRTRTPASAVRIFCANYL